MSVLPVMRLQHRWDELECDGEHWLAAQSDGDSIERLLVDLVVGFLGLLRGLPEQLRCGR